MFVLVAFHYAAAEDAETHDTRNNTRIRVQIGGSEASAPVFEDNREYVEERKEFDRSLIKEVNRLISEFVEAIVIKKKNTIWTGAKYGKEMISFVSQKTKEMRQLIKSGIDEKMIKNYPKKMSKLIKTVLDTKSNVVLSREECYAKMKALLNSLEEITKKSPVGIYQDWTKMKINNKTIEEYSSPIVAWFRSNGYGVAISLMRTLTGLLDKLSF